MTLVVGSWRARRSPVGRGGERAMRTARAVRSGRWTRTEYTRGRGGGCPAAEQVVWRLEAAGAGGGGAVAAGGLAAAGGERAGPRRRGGRGGRARGGGAPPAA